MTTYIAYRDEDGRLFGEAGIKDHFDEMLNETYGMVTIGGYEYETSRALESTDPIAYRVGFSDFTSEFEEVIFHDFDEYFAAIS